MATITTEFITQKSGGLERVHYFERMLITVQDMVDEQNYFRDKLRRHNRRLHGWGVVCGCTVEPYPQDGLPWLVRICPGYVVTPSGDEINIAEPVMFDLAGDWRQAVDPCANNYPCPPRSVIPPANEVKQVYLAVCYNECNIRPTHVQPIGCECDETACEYSRTRESFDLQRLFELPVSHQVTKDWENAYQKQYADWQTALKKSKIPVAQPVPACLECEGDCVVLATIKLPARRDAALRPLSISYLNRRVLLPTGLCCMP